jgi:hypothetical protein
MTALRPKLYGAGPSSTNSWAFPVALGQPISPSVLSVALVLCNVIWKDPSRLSLKEHSGDMFQEQEIP